MPLLPRTFLTAILAACFSTSVLAAELSPLAEAAKAVASKLPAGAIVTGERIGDVVSYGSAGHLEPGGIPPEKVVFEIGSISKVFTGLLLAQAVLEGRLKVDTTLKEVLGDKQAFADPAVAAITLQQLATHTSGLPRVPEGLDDGDNPYAGFGREKLSKYLADLKLEGRPPFDASYSNLGFGILGEVLSRTYDKPWDELVHERITGPLGMQDTAVRLSEDLARRFAPAYSKGKAVKPWTFAALAGAGALRSTAADMITFGDALLAPEKTPLKDAIQLLLRPHNRDGTMGFAIGISKLDGETLYEHSGGTGGYRSILQVMPASRRVRVVLINNDMTDASLVVLASRPKEAKAAFKEGKAPADAQLGELTGVYKLGTDAQFTVLSQDHQLHARLTGQTFLPLFAEEQADRFFYKAVAAELQFTRESGKVAGLTLFQNGRELKAVKTADPAPAYHLQPAARLKPYEGSYQMAPGLILTMKVRDNTLFGQLTGQPFLAGYETAPDCFEVADVKASLHFERDAAGAIIAVTLHQNGQDTRAVRQK